MYLQHEGLLTFLNYTQKSAYKCFNVLLEYLPHSVLILNIITPWTTTELQNNHRKAFCQANNHREIKVAGRTWDNWSNLLPKAGLTSQPGKVSTSICRAQWLKSMKGQVFLAAVPRPLEQSSPVQCSVKICAQMPKSVCHPSLTPTPNVQALHSCTLHLLLFNCLDQSQILSGKSLIWSVLA